MDRMASLNIDHLPSEILIQMLSPLPTSDLLPLARVNSRFYDLTLRIIHTRLTDAARLPEHDLALECYHPAEKNSSPNLHCEYLGTDGLAGYTEDDGAQPAFGQLHGLYSRFRPVVRDDQNPAADGPAPSVTVELDEGEMFSQLCAATKLVKTGPMHGLFRSHVNLNNGVMRVFRRWLAARAAGDDSEDPILWTDRSKTVGLKFAVAETSVAPLAPRPAFPARVVDEDPAATYTLVYEELLVRTSTLLLEMEESEAQETTSAKADLGFVVEPGSKVPCLGQQMFFWIQPPQNVVHRQQQQWGAAAPFISVGGA